VTLTGLAARNVLRNRFRTLLTIVGVAVAILLFMLLRTLVYAWTVGADYSMKDRLVTRHKITFVMTLPKRYIDDVRAAPHIREATFANWFGAKDPKHDKEFFATIAVDSPTYFKVFDDFGVPPEQMKDWLQDPQGALVGDALAKKLGWKIGDRVMLESGIFAHKPQWEFTIRGLYFPKAKSADRSSFFFHWDYLNKNLNGRNQDQIGWIVSRTDDPKRTADVALAVDKLFDDKEMQTLSQDEHSFQASFLASVSAILNAIDVISLVILLIMMLVLGNTIAMGVRERTNEYGVLKALGFSGGRIAFFIMAESLIIAMCGAALGIGLAYPFIEQGMGRWLEENLGQFFPYFRIDPMITIAAVALALALGAIAAAIPAMRASKLKVVDALRRVA
jgi:putative ABC transport system permease protein